MGYFEELGILIWVLLKSEKMHTLQLSCKSSLQVVLHVGFHKQAQSMCEVRGSRIKTNDLGCVFFLKQKRRLACLLQTQPKVWFWLTWKAWGTPWLHGNSIRKKMVWFSFSSWCDV
jgi:hypothetical protein